MSRSPVVLEHNQNPRNVGTFDTPDTRVGTGEARSQDGSTRIRIQILVAEGRVEAARFRTLGCPASIAACSLLTEWAREKTLDELRAIQASQLADALELEPNKRGRAELAKRALDAACGDWEHEQAR